MSEPPISPEEGYTAEDYDPERLIYVFESRTGHTCESFLKKFRAWSETMSNDGLMTLKEFERQTKLLEVFEEGPYKLPVYCELVIPLYETDYCPWSIIWDTDIVFGYHPILKEKLIQELIFLTKEIHCEHCGNCKEDDIINYWTEENTAKLIKVFAEKYDNFDLSYYWLDRNRDNLIRRYADASDEIKHRKICEEIEKLITVCSDSDCGLSKEELTDREDWEELRKHHTDTIKGTYENYPSYHLDPDYEREMESMESDDDDDDEVFYLDV